MLSIHDLAVGYGRVSVLRDLCLELQPACVHGLVGRNGEGKTTLLETVYGFVRPWKGEVRVGGRPAGPREVAYLPMENFFYPGITGREYLRIFVRGGAFDADAWGGLFDLPLDRPVDGYSAGMRKKLALLGVVALDRPVVMLDEPTNGLDLESNLVLARLLRELAGRGSTLLLTSHVLESLASTCDWIHVLEGGTVARSVPRAEFGELEASLLSGAGDARVERMRQLLG